MVNPPLISKTGVGTYWGQIGTIPKAEAIPLFRPGTTTPVPELAATVAPDAGWFDVIVFQALSDPGVDPVNIDDYKGWLYEDGWVYLDTPNAIFMVRGFQVIDDTTFIAYIINGALPAIADANYALVVPQRVCTSKSYNAVVTGTSAVINGVSIASGLVYKEPGENQYWANPCSFDCSGAGAELTITFNT